MRLEITVDRQRCMGSGNCPTAAISVAEPQVEPA